MTSWIVEVVNTASGSTAKIALIDAAGPLNTWRSLTKDAFLPEGGSFLNQLRRVAPMAQPSWELKDLDIDENNVGRSGNGEVLDNPKPPATFPTGPIVWKVIGEFQGD